MLNRLKQIYPNLIVYDNEQSLAYEEYFWFITADQEDIIGISKKDIDQQALQLLQTFLQPYHIDLPEQSVTERRWYEMMLHGTKEENGDPYRFVYFSIEQHNIDPHTFKEAISELFEKTIPIIWLNQTSGIIVEQYATTDEPINYDQIIDIIMTDLYVNIKFFIGEVQTDFTDIQQYYTNVIKLSQFIFKNSNKNVINYIEAIPYLFIEQITPHMQDELITSILKEFENDEDMLHTIETFLSCNLNVSETAKKLYLHRNSLQYRIDKFIQKTGINIQNFNEAMTVKLALLIKNHLEL